MTASRIFSLDGKGLKLDTRQDLEPWLKDLDPAIIEEIHLGGNTIGVEASKALAEFIDKTTSLKVSRKGLYTSQKSDLFRSQTLQTFSPVV